MREKQTVEAHVMMTLLFKLINHQKIAHCIAYVNINWQQFVKVQLQ